jgi:hypothetical protein
MLKIGLKLMDLENWMHIYSKAGSIISFSYDAFLSYIHILPFLLYALLIIYVSLETSELNIECSFGSSA